MRSLTLALPLFGGILGIIGYLQGLFWLLMIGATLSFINEFLNLASGLYSFPFIAIIINSTTIFFVSPWLYGLALGLSMAALIDGLGEIYGRLKS